MGARVFILTITRIVEKKRGAKASPLLFLLHFLLFSAAELTLCPGNEKERSDRRVLLN